MKIEEARSSLRSAALFYARMIRSNSPGELAKKDAESELLDAAIDYASSLDDKSPIVGRVAVQDPATGDQDPDPATGDLKTECQEACRRAAKAAENVAAGLPKIGDAFPVASGRPSPGEVAKSIQDQVDELKETIAKIESVVRAQSEVAMKDRNVAASALNRAKSMERDAIEFQSGTNRRLTRLETKVEGLETEADVIVGFES